jgi:hypothetical protein
MRQAVHLYGDNGNLIGEKIGWVERYDGGKQWKGFTRHGALPFRRSRPDAVAGGSRGRGGGAAETEQARDLAHSSDRLRSRMN